MLQVPSMRGKAVIPSSSLLRKKSKGRADELDCRIKWDLYSSLSQCMGGKLWSPKESLAVFSVGFLWEAQEGWNGGVLHVLHKWAFFCNKVLIMFHQHTIKKNRKPQKNNKSRPSSHAAWWDHQHTDSNHYLQWYWLSVRTVGQTLSPIIRWTF